MHPEKESDFLKVTQDLGRSEIRCHLSPSLLGPSEMDTSHWSLGSLGGLEDESLEGNVLAELLYTLLPKGVWGLVAHLLPQSQQNRSGWWKGKFALLQIPASGAGADICLKANSPPCLATSGARAFIDRGGGYMQKQHSEV